MGVCVEPRPCASKQFDSPSSAALATIVVELQTFGRPRADFPATIQIHSGALENDLSTTSDQPTKLSFPNLPPGEYQVRATAPSREPVQLGMKLEAGQSAKMALIVDRSFPLTLVADTSARGGSTNAPGLLGSKPEGIQAAPTPGMGTAEGTSAPSVNTAAAGEGATREEADASASPDIPAPPAEAAPPKLLPFVSACRAEEILPRISANVREFVDSINRITATELMNFERHSQKGRLEEKAQNKVNYVATIQPLANGFLSVDEYRNGSPGMSGFQGHIASTGSAALVLIFHPMHLDEFAMNCEGLVMWHDMPVFEIKFQQRMDRPNTMSEFRAGNMAYNIHLKGTAFVDPETFQILHLETDLMKPIPQLTLDAEHQSIDYGPVVFAAHNDNLWLPQYAEITVRYRNKEFNERHTYTNYRLFLVETGQKISKVPNPPPPPN